MPTALDIAAPLVALAEGFRTTAYQDSGGVWTIGFGRTGTDVVQGLTTTIEQESAWFAQRAGHLAAQIPISTATLEAAALIDFGYNCGSGALAAVLAGTDTIDNPKHMTDRHGNVQGGLVARRKLEAVLIQLSQGG